MEAIRDVALAHYEALPDQEKIYIQNNFKKVVADGNITQYFYSIHHRYNSEIVEECLESKGHKEGSIDFKDFITLKYILEKLTVGKCGECSKLLLGRAFFSCYDCFVDSYETYDICCACYGSEMFRNHNHSKFYDIQTLYFLSKRVLAKEKGELRKRERIFEHFMIDRAREFTEFASSVKYNEWWNRFNRNLNFQKYKGMAFTNELSGLAKKNAEWWALMEETKSAEKDHEEELNEDVESTYLIEEEDSIMHRDMLSIFRRQCVDLLGAKASGPI